jgi:hypothetical protein
MDAQGGVDDERGSQWEGISSEDEINFDDKAERGEIGSEDDFKSGNEFERGGTDSEDEINCDGESEHVECSGQLQIHPDSTKILSVSTLFPKLPIEIRLKIWEYDCFFTRNVDIWAKNIKGVVCDETGEVAHYFHSYTSPPSLLHVCKESRFEALQHYQLEFGTTCKYTIRGVAPEVTILTSPRIYINWVVDRICAFNPDTFQGECLSDESVRFKELLNRCCEMKLRSLAWNYFSLDFQVFEFVDQAMTMEELIIFSDARWTFPKQCRPAGEFEFEDMQKPERDVLKEEVERDIGYLDWPILDSREYPLNIHYCNVRLLEENPT